MNTLWEHVLIKGGQIGWWELGLLPFWAGFIGWFTTWLAIKMIFRPQRAYNILGFKVQGLIHKRQQELAESIGRTVERHLISHADVLAIINRPETQAAIGSTVEARVSTFMEEKLKKLHPMVGMFMGGGLKEKLHRTLVEEIQGVIPEFMDQMMERLESELDFQAIIVEKINQFDMNQLETIIHEIARKELRSIEFLCGVLGLVVGVMQVAFMLL
jgi:uncharacterized membrane protein YheB (UPF0754 family)